MPEIKYTNKFSQEERVARRLNNSGEGAGADQCIQKGEGPTRCITNVHLSGSAKQLKRKGDE
jgi:hypothetical protein